MGLGGSGFARVIAENRERPFEATRSSALEDRHARRYEPNRAMSERDVAPVEFVIRARGGAPGLDLRELIRFRELLFFLVWRDVKVRYKEAALGAAWAVLQPVISIAVFTVIFGRFGGLDRRLPAGFEDKYPVFVLAGLLPWSFFANAVQLGGLSLLNQSHLLRKLYFPRLFLPAAVVGGHFLDLAISGVILGGLMLFYGVRPGVGILFFPALVGLTVIAALGIAFLLSALTASFRDVRYLIPFLVQTWMFASPVLYPGAIVGEPWGRLLALNPMFGIIGGFRSSLLGLEPNWMNLAVSSSSSLLLFVLGLYVFRRTEQRFADVL